MLTDAYDSDLARAKLVRIHHINQDAFSRFTIQVLAIELGRHLAPDLGALDSSQIAIIPQFHPIRLVQLGPNEKIEIGNLVILTDQSSSKT